MTRRKERKPIVVDVNAIERVEARHLLGFGYRAWMTSMRVQKSTSVEMLESKRAWLNLFEVQTFQRLSGRRHYNPVGVTVLERNGNNRLLVRC